MASIFTKIIQGDIPAHKVAENTDYLAFLDINPLVMGHVLVIPKKEVDYIFDLDDETYLGLHAFAKEVAIGLKKAVPCVRIGTAVVGLEVPHVHIHLVPMNTMDDLNFSRPKLHPGTQELEKTAELIRNSLLER